MYLDFFQLQKAPFHVTPDPDFFCSFPSHREALATLIYGVMLKKGFIALTGEVGVGKTTILRSFLKRIEQREDIKVIYLLNADVSFNDLLQTLLHEFDAIPASESAFMRVNQLHHILIDQFRQGRNVVLIVDEAQNMPVETLEGLRVLSNLETSTDKLLQIVFCGQPEFDDLLERPELRQLQQRIAVRAVVRPLTAAEGIRYIQRRFFLAGATDRVIFTPDAIKRIVKEARGIPRLINILCDNALVTACGHHQQQVQGRVAREIIADCQVRSRPRTGWWSVPPAGVAAAVLAAGVLLSGAIYFGLMRGAPQLAPVEPRGTQGGAIDSGLTQGPPPSPAETARLPPAPPSPDRVAAPTPAVLPVAPDAPTAEGAQTAAAEPATVTTGEPEPVTRVVKTGDRLTDLVEEVYGVRDERLVQWVQRHNPQIKNNSNLIRIGDRLVFPPADHQELGNGGDNKALPSRVP